MPRSRVPTCVPDRQDRGYLFSDESGVSPIVAVLVLIVVAILGAGFIAVILGNLNADVSKRVNDVDIENEAGVQLLIAGSPVMLSLDQLLAGQYEITHPGVTISCDGYGSALGAAAAGTGSADIGALSRKLTSGELSRYPGLEPVLIGGRAVVVIAHDDLDTLPTIGVSLPDLQTVYSQTEQVISPMLSDVRVAVRNTDDAGSDEIFSRWLTEGQSATLDGYDALPEGVTLVDASSDEDVFSAVSSTPGAIGYIDWLYVADNDPAVSHVNVIPIVNNANGQVQVPDSDSIPAEIINMNNDSYESGLANQYYYVTKGDGGMAAENFIKFTRSPEAVPLFHQAYAYSVLDLG